MIFHSCSEYKNVVVVGKLRESGVAPQYERRFLYQFYSSFHSQEKKMILKKRSVNVSYLMQQFYKLPLYNNKNAKKSI